MRNVSSEARTLQFCAVLSQLSPDTSEGFFFSFSAQQAGKLKFWPKMKKTNVTFNKNAVVVTLIIIIVLIESD